MLVWINGPFAGGKTQTTKRISMDYAIIGSGNIGQAVARRFAQANLPVRVATAKGANAVKPLVEQIGPQIMPVEVLDALRAEVVVLATPFEAVREIVEQVPDWNQRIIIDATNAIDHKDFSPADLGGRPSSELVAEWAGQCPRRQGVRSHRGARARTRAPVTDAAAGGCYSCPVTTPTPTRRWGN